MNRKIVGKILLLCGENLVRYPLISSNIPDEVADEKE
jgi:hypothetical protein